MSPIRVLVVDDDPMVRSALSMIIESTPDIRVVSEATDGTQVAAEVASFQPDVVLMDIRMPKLDGLAATRLLLQDDSTAHKPHVIILTTFEADDQVLQALRAGAGGFLLKDTAPAEIVESIRKVVEGEAILSPSVTRRLISHVAGEGESEGAGARRSRAVALMAQLSEREREVAQAVALGKSNAEIAEQLFMSVATVKAHVSKLLEKLKAENRVQVALIAHDASMDE